MMAVAHSAANSPRSHAGSAAVSAVSHGRPSSLASYLSGEPAATGPQQSTAAVGYAGNLHAGEGLVAQQGTPLPSAAGSVAAMQWATNAVTPGVSIAAAAAAALAAAATPAVQFDEFSESEDEDSSDASDLDAEDADAVSDALNSQRSWQPTSSRWLCGAAGTGIDIPTYGVDAAGAGLSALQWQAGSGKQAQEEPYSLGDSNGEGAASPQAGMEACTPCAPHTVPLDGALVADQSDVTSSCPTAPGSGAVKWVAADVAAPVSSIPASEQSSASDALAAAGIVSDAVVQPPDVASKSTDTAAESGGTGLPNTESICVEQSANSDASTADPTQLAPLLERRPSRIPRPPGGTAAFHLTCDAAAEEADAARLPCEDSAEQGVMEEDEGDYSIAAVFSELAMVAKLEAASSHGSSMPAAGARRP